MTEFERISRVAIQSLERGEITALATVVRVRGSAPRHDGARMLIWPDGRIEGTVGGATLELRVIEHAIEAINSRMSRLERYLFSTKDDPESVGLCGGAVEVHIEVLEPDPILYIIGAGHIAQPLAVMGNLIGMRVVVVDDREEFASLDRFPDAERVEAVTYHEEEDSLTELPAGLGPKTFVVVATWGWDEPALAQVIAADPPPSFIGLVASETKARVIRERLLERGLPEQAVESIRSPIGLDLGAETPEEIAMAILAEILLVRRKATGHSMDKTHD